MQTHTTGTQLNAQQARLYNNETICYAMLFSGVPRCLNVWIKFFFNIMCETVLFQNQAVTSLLT